MYTLTEKELDNLLLRTGTYTKTTNKKEKQGWKNAFRKVESETNQQIKDAGSMKHWYERGRC